MNIDNLILGAGATGLSASYHLRKQGIKSVICEQEESFGGLCGSFEVSGFTFDTFAHISFDDRKDISELLEGKTRYLTHQSDAYNYADGLWIRNPVQMNLSGLPVEERVRIIEDFICRKDPGNYGNYAEWLNAKLGEYFAERYPRRYTKKYWTVEPERLDAKWIEGRMYIPDLTELLRGAITFDTPEVHYSKHARYPVEGGFRRFLEYMEKKADVFYNKKVVRIDLPGRRVFFADGDELTFRTLYSTIPLPELVRITDGVPDRVMEAAERLDYTSGIMVSVALSKPHRIPSLWFYIYNEEIEVSRVYSVDGMSSRNVPDGCSAFQAELYYSRYKEKKGSLNEIGERTVTQLGRLGFFEKKDILFVDVREKQYANIMFTPQIYENRLLIREWFARKGIHTGGRFGEWDYLWLGQCVDSGKRMIEEVL